MDEHLRSITLAGVAGADPEQVLRSRVWLEGQRLHIDDTVYDLTQFDRVLLLGAGKAAARMATVLESILGDALTAGVVVVKHGHLEPLQRVRLMEAGHPVPDAPGILGATALLEAAHEATDRDLVLFALTGGASAVTPLPAEGITLTEKQEATSLLLSCGASIHEVNAVRKHLSRFKGGQLARALVPATVVTLIVSDVVGDDLDVIGSGPTAPDPSTFASALEVIRTYGLEAQMPSAVMARLRAGLAGDIDDTPGPEDSCFAAVDNRIMASNTLALKAAASKARDLGYTPLVLTSRLQGEAREVAKVLTTIAETACEIGSPVAAPCCILAGGETTVRLRGKGKGGRNQELVLAALCVLKESPYRDRICIASVGTDGTDGPTDAAGACAVSETTSKCRSAGLDAQEYLAANDAYHFFEQLDGLIKTGPTGTNVMDLIVLLVQKK